MGGAGGGEEWGEAVSGPWMRFGEETKGSTATEVRSSIENSAEKKKVFKLIFFLMI